MKKVPFAFSIALVLAIFCACKKNIPASLFPPRTQESLLVDEYLLPQYNGALFDFPLLFKKKYALSGKLNQIDLSFENTFVPAYSLEHDFSVVQNGLKLYLLKTSDPTDTGVVITLNGQGKVTSCHVTKETNDINGRAEMEYFYYKNDRIWYIKTVPDAGVDFTFPPSEDTVYYDSHGNPAVFAFNTYQYDYTRKIAFQYYIDDQMESTPGYYVCQYLGYFPEVTSPPNLRIHVQADEFNLTLSDYQFDAAGRMISYNYSIFGGVTIVWHLL
jgi:hypothetical protein